MLDLQPIKDRLAAATPGPWSASPSVLPKDVTEVAEVGHIFIIPPGQFWRSSTVDADLIANAPTDLAALVAEVQRLRADVQLYKGRIEQHKEATARYGGPNSLDNRMLWEVLNA